MRILPLILFLLSFIPATAQQVDDTINLQRIDIKASKLTPYAGYKTKAIDSTLIQENIYESLGGILSRHSTLYIKSYGRGGIATPAFRGTTSSHTQVYWNGLELTSPMLGETDLSTIPGTISENVSIDFGGSSLARGSGGFGGAVNIESQPSWNRELDINLFQGFGSFGSFHTLVGLGIGNKKIQSDTRIFHQQSQNDFNYTNTTKPGQPEEKRENAGFRNTGFLQELYFLLNKEQVLSAKVWAQWNDRDIPGTTTQSTLPSEEHMEQQFVRSVIDWKKYYQKGFLDIRTGYFYDSDNYQNNNANIDTRNTVHSAYAKAGMGKEFLQGFLIKGELSHSYYSAQSPNLSGTGIQNISAVYLNAQIKHHERLFLDIIIRQELIDGQLSPFLPSFGIEYLLLKNEDFRIKGNISRNYRNPTMNDLYWNYDGFSKGNPDLEPEKGISADMGLAYSKDIAGKYYIGSGLTVFYVLIDEMIYWAPVIDPVYFWYPQNLKQIKSRGLEINIDFRMKIKKHSLAVVPSYTYTKSTFTEVHLENDQSLGKQLVYVPIHKGIASIIWSLGNMYMTCNLQYIGKRYTSSDNSQDLPAVWLNDWVFEKQFKIRKHTLSAQFNINNIWDEDYQLVTRQPMPGRSFMLTFKYIFNK